MFDNNVLFRVSLGRNIGDTGKVSDSQVSSFLADTVSKHFDGFAVSFGLGYWQGKPEETVHIDIVSEDSDSARSGLKSIAAEYNTRFNQQCVLITRADIGASFQSLRLAESEVA